MIPELLKLTPSTTFERLLTEAEAVEALGLSDRPNPAGALRWLIRVGKLKRIELGRGIISFRPADIAACIERSRK